MPRLNGKFVKQSVYDEYMNSQNKAVTTDQQQEVVNMELRNDINVGDEMESDKPFDFASVGYLSLVKNNDNSDIADYQANNSTQEITDNSLEVSPELMKELEELDTTIEQAEAEDAPILAQWNVELDAMAEKPWFTKQTFSIRKIIELGRAGKINTRMAYQRGDAKKWLDPIKQSKLFKSIMLGRPTQNVDWRISPDPNFDYEIVDGKQRFNAIFRIVNGEVTFDELPPPLDDYNGLTFPMLPEDVREKFLSYSMDVNLIDAMDDDEIIDYYGDKNTGAVGLTAAEANKGKLDPRDTFFRSFWKSDLWRFLPEKTPIQDSGKKDIVRKFCKTTYGQSNDYASTLVVRWFIAWEPTTGAKLEIEKRGLMVARIMAAINEMEGGAKVVKRIMNKTAISTLLCIVDDKTDWRNAALELFKLFDSKKDNNQTLAAYMASAGAGSAQPEKVKARMDILRGVINKH